MQALSSLINALQFRKILPDWKYSLGFDGSISYSSDFFPLFFIN